MTTVIQREAIVGPGGNIEITVPELTSGQRVTVTIQPEQIEAPVKRRAIDILSKAPGHLEFKTAEAVDAYIREERDSWDR